MSYFEAGFSGALGVLAAYGSVAVIVLLLYLLSVALHDRSR